MTRPLPVFLVLVAALAAGVMGALRLPSPPVPGPSRAVPRATALPASPEFRLGLPDCPAAAIGDLRAPDALLCWFTDEAFGPWHTTSSLEIQGITIARIFALDRRVALPVARRLVDQGGSDAEEVLVYAKGPRGGQVTRVRWTRRAGFETTEFEVR